MLLLAAEEDAEGWIKFVCLDTLPANVIYGERSSGVGAALDPGVQSVTAVLAAGMTGLGRAIKAVAGRGRLWQRRPGNACPFFKRKLNEPLRALFGIHLIRTTRWR